jgi:hypothetical protein
MNLYKSLVGTYYRFKIGQLAQVFECQRIPKMNQNAGLGSRQGLDFIQDVLIHTKLIQGLVTRYKYGQKSLSLPLQLRRKEVPIVAKRRIVTNFALPVFLTPKI